MLGLVHENLIRILLIGALLICNVTNGQEISVINSKGTRSTVNNNTVTTATTAPTDPLEGDVWFDNTDSNQVLTKIWDGTAWVTDAHQETVGSIFFAGANGYPTGDNGELFWDNTNNRLGIGTALPDESIHVANNIRLDGAFEDKDGEAGTSGQVLSSTATGTDWVTPTPETVTSLSQNTTTGLITYTNEATVDQTANVVAAESNNDITVGANGGALFESMVKAIGKVSSAGAVVRATTGITITKLAGNGHYRVNLPAGLVSDADYIIQLAQPGRGGAGNDDPGISYSNQTSSSFEVIIGDNDNGGTDRARYNSEFMFVIFDL